MANEYVDVRSLFYDIASSIRSKDGSKEAIPAFDFPDRISSLGKVAVTQWDDKFAKIDTPTISTVSAAITVKAITYHDGYWYAVGTDSAGDAYKLYGETIGNLTAVKIGTSRYYPVTGIACDGTNVWCCNTSGAYSNRVLFRQTLADFRSSNATITVGVNATYYAEDMCTVAGYGIVAFGGNSEEGALFRIAKGSGSFTCVNYTVTKSKWTRGCTYNGKPVALDFSGVIGHWFQFPNNNTLQTRDRDYLAGAQKICQMGDYLCVAVTKEDGTYLYVNSGADWIDRQFWNFKITDEVLTVVGMAYVGGLYTLIGVNSDGETKAWQASSLEDRGIYGRTMSITDGYTPRVLATDGTNICVLADNGSNVLKALATIN